jgi:hypothetical protein
MTNDQFPMTNGGTRAQRAVFEPSVGAYPYLVIPVIIRERVRE